MKKIISAILIIANIFVFSGCASYHSLPLPSTDYTEWKYNQNIENVIVAVRFLGREEVGHYFQRAMYKFGVYPAFLVIDNQTNNSYEFERDMIKSPKYTPNQVSDYCGSSGFRRAGIFALVYIIFSPALILGIPAGINAASTNNRMRNDFSAKEINFGDIHPNRKLSGFVYLGQIKSGDKLDLTLRDKDSKRELNFIFIKED
jgi:hypothetical protein